MRTLIEGRVIKLELIGREYLAAFRKLAQRLAALEQQMRNAVLPPGFGGGGGGLVPALVTTAIPTGTLASPSSAGRVTTYRDDGSGGLEAAETGVEVRNHHTVSSSIAAGKAVTVYRRGNSYWLVAADC